MVARMEMELAHPALAGMKVPAHDRSAAMGDGPDGAPLCLAQRGFSTQEGRQEAAQHVDDGGGHVAGGGPDVLTGKFPAEFFHQGTTVLLAAVRQVQIDHSGVDAAVAQQVLHRVQTRPGFHQMGCETMA